MAGHAPSTTLREDEDDDPLPLPGVARLHEIGERRPAERRELYHRLSMSLACDSLGDGTRDTVHMHIRFPLSTPVPPDAHEVAIRTAAGMVEDSPQSRSAKFDGDEEWEAELEFEQANLTEYEDRGSATICVRSHEGIDAAGVREGQIVRYAERRARQILREARSVLAEAKPPRRQVRHQHFGVGWVIADHGAEVEVDFGDRGVWRIDRRYVVGDETAC